MRGFQRLSGFSNALIWYCLSGDTRSRAMTWTTSIKIARPIGPMSSREFSFTLSRYQAIGMARK
jgi:hypothetical protein